MDTKARIAVVVGGVVLVGMVAWQLMPGDSAKSTSDSPVTDTAQTGDKLDEFAATPATSPSVAVDPFALPTTYPAPLVNIGPSLTPADSTDAWARALDGNTVSTSSGPSSSALPARGTDAFTPTFSGSRLGVPSTTVIPADASNTPKTYTVVAGDSLYTISERALGSSKHVNKIIAANPGINPSRLKVGQKIKLPDVSGTTPAATASSVTPLVSARPVATSSVKTYKVQPGDTLRKISAKVYDGDSTKWEKLYNANRTLIGSNPSNLRAGSVLQVPSK